MKKSITGVIISTMLFSGCVYFNLFYNAKQSYRKGELESLKIMSKALSSSAINFYQQTVDKCLKLLDYYPNSKYADDALLLIGKSYYHLQKHLNARYRLQELRTDFPDSELIIEADLWLAKISVALEEYDQAETAFETLLLKKFSKEMKGEAYFFLGKLYEKRRKYKQAITTYEQALKNNLESYQSEAVFSIAADYDTLGQFDKAAQYFQKVRKYNPSDEIRFEAQFRHAQTLKKMNRIDEEIKLLDKFLADEANQSRFADITLEIGKCLIWNKDYEDAVVTLQDITEEFKKTNQAAEAYFLLGQIYKNQYLDYEKALLNFIEVSNSSVKSAYADTAEINKRDLQRILALQQVIGMGIKGESGEDVSVDGGTFLSQRRNMDDDLFSLDSLNVSNQIQNTTVTTGQTGNLHPMLELEENNKILLEDELEKKKVIENPELKTFKKEELDRNLFLIAELYLFTFSLPDSALLKYQTLLKRFPDSPFAPKALFNMGYIYEVIYGYMDKADSVYNELLLNYSKSPLAPEARKKIDTDSDFRKENSERQLLLLAEKYLFDEKDYANAQHYYSRIIQEYPDSDLAPKAYYSLGWIAENKLNAADQALAYYDNLIKTYPESPYAVNVRTKVEIVKTASASDTVQTPSTAIQDSSIIPKALSIPGEKVIPAEENLKLHGDEEELILSRNRLTEETLEAEGDSAGLKISEDVVIRDIIIATEAAPEGGVNAIVKNIEYPKRIDKNRFVGIVVIQVYVDEKGQVLDMELLEKEQDPLLSNLLLQALKKTEFTPAMTDSDEPVSSWVTITLPLN